MNGKTRDLKWFAKQPVKLMPGHKTCQGCGIPIIVRFVMAASEKPLVTAQGTGCISVTTPTWPYTSWKVPTIHNAFACLASTISGAETAYRALKKKGIVKKELNFVGFGGDGGSYDIGLQALSGALERKHNLVYVCYDNQAYSNTGNQRSSATQKGTATTTTPEGLVHHGKELFRKDLTEIVAAHDIPYVAQSAIYPYGDLVNKAAKAFEAKGPAFINALSPCALFWGIDTGLAYHISKLAVETCYWPIYEVENGKYKLSFKPKEKLPVEEFLKPQKRFKHLLKPENTYIVKELQEHIDRKWDKLLKKCSEK